MPGSALLLCLVIAIADGDTLTARCDTPAGKENITVRLAEIDAPEKRQPFGNRSRQHPAELCFKKAAEVQPRARDRYGRTVGRVTCEGIDASAEQVRAGMAWAYKQYITDAAIPALERQAREWRIGLWAEPSPIPPWARRKSSAERCVGPPPWPKSCPVDLSTLHNSAQAELHLAAKTK